MMIRVRTSSLGRLQRAADLLIGLRESHGDPNGFADLANDYVTALHSVHDLLKMDYQGRPAFRAWWKERDGEFRRQEEWQQIRRLRNATQHHRILTHRDYGSGTAAVETFTRFYAVVRNLVADCVATFESETTSDAFDHLLGPDAPHDYPAPPRRPLELGTSGGRFTVVRNGLVRFLSTSR